MHYCLIIHIGTISWVQCGTGGPVIDHHGNVVGLSIPCIEGISAILPISTALSCLNMWTEFGFVSPLVPVSFYPYHLLMYCYVD